MTTNKKEAVIPRKKDLFVKHSYDLVNAAYVLDKTEKKIVAMGIVQMMNGELSSVRGAYPVTIQYSQYRNYFGASENLARDIKTAVRRLQQKLVVLYHQKEKERPDPKDIELVNGADEDSTTEYNWASKADHYPRKGYSVIYFNDELFDLILKEGGHTQVLLTHIAQIENKYTYRLYDSILSWVGIRAKHSAPSNRNNISFSVQWIAERYLIPASYMTRRAFFEKKFLQPCVKDINGVSELNLRYEFNIKEGGFKNSTITFWWDLDKVVKQEYSFKKLPTLEDFNDDEADFLELALVYIETFTPEMEKPNMLWGMKLAEIHQKLKSEPLNAEVLAKLAEIAG